MAKQKRGQGRSKHHRAALLKARASADAVLLEALDGLRQLRTPYEPLLMQIVAETLRAHPPLSGGGIVELGAGTGQLARWLPPEVLPRVLHTDPSGQALATLTAQRPQSRTAVASAHRLPFADGSCAGALGLCVFDALHGAAPEEAAVAELGRVLGSGAPFIHFLDMTTLLERPFVELHAQGLVPFPNVFSDPDDHEWPLDLVLFDREWLRQVLHFALRIEHPLVTTFGPYFGAFLLDPYEPKQAMLHFKAIASNSALQRSLAMQLSYVIQGAVQQGLPPRAAIPFHSGRHLAETMEAAFSRSPSFEIKSSQVVARGMYTPADSAQPSVRYRSLALGHERVMTSLPKRRLAPIVGNEPKVVGAPDEPSLATESRADQMLVEAAVFVFVAQRK